MTQGNVYLDFNVGEFSVSRPWPISVSSFSRNHVFARFNFSASWSGLDATAIFARSGVGVRHVPIVDGEAQIPEAFMREAGEFTVSVFAGDRRTTVSATVCVETSGFAVEQPPGPPPPDRFFVQSPNVPEIYEDDDMFFGLVDGVPKPMGGGVGGDVAAHNMSPTAHAIIQQRITGETEARTEDVRVLTLSVSGLKTALGEHAETASSETNFGHLRAWVEGDVVYISTDPVVGGGMP